MLVPVKSALELVTPPVAEPVTVAEAKLHCRIDIPDDDALIAGYIAAARSWAETFTRRAFVTQTWRMTLDRFPSSCGAIELPNPKLVSVGHVKHIDGAGVQQTLVADTDFVVHAGHTPGQVVPAYGRSWPATRAVPNAVEILYEAGYGDPAAVPEGIKLGMKMLVAHWYEHRESVVMGTIVGEVPQTVEFLLWPFRVYRFS